MWLYHHGVEASSAKVWLVAGIYTSYPGSYYCNKLNCFVYAFRNSDSIIQASSPASFK